MAILFFDPAAWLAHEHPAMVHLPIAAALLVPVALLLSHWRQGEGWRRMAKFLAWAGLLGSGAALLSGLLWGRQLDLIAPGGWVAKAQDGHLQSLLRTHQLLALSGFVLGLMTLAVLHRTRERVVLPALVLSLAWAAAWGAAGHWGGRMVFPDMHESDTQAAHEEMQGQMQEPAPPLRDFHKVFLEMCASCHGQDGSARMPSGRKMHGQDFTDPKWQASRTDAQIVKVIQGGKGHMMPAFRGMLSESDTLALVQLVLRPMKKRNPS